MSLDTLTLAASDSVPSLRRIAKAARDAADALDRLLAENIEREAALAAFRKASSARLIAEILLANDGMWVSKQDLATTAQVTPSVVPRVVRSLVASGFKVERQIVKGSAYYRVVGE